MDKKKVKKQKKGGINLFSLLLIVAVIVVGIILIKNKKTSSNSKIKYSNINKGEAENIEKYVQENYLDYNFLETIGNISTEQDKIRCTIDVLNLQNEEPASEILEADVVTKYKELFGEPLLITEHAFSLSNGYLYNSENKFTLNSDFEITSKTNNNSSKLLIAGCEKSKNAGEYIISIKGVSLKSLDEILEYAKANPKKFDLNKLSEIKVKEELDENDVNYLNSLITNDTLEDLTFENFKSKLTVKDAENGKYAIVSYEYGK